MIEQAQLVTPEQVMAFLGVVGVLVVANLGQLISWALRTYKRKLKEEFDINIAFKRIRELEQKLSKIEEEKKS